MTGGVYGLVAAIVKLDDGGQHLSQRAGEGVFARVQRRLGAAILATAPWLMRALSIAGTAAMFLVGGGILVHGVSPVHHWVEHLGNAVAATLPAIGGFLGAVLPAIAAAVIGVAAGAVVFAAVSAVKRVMRPRAIET